MFIDLIYSYFLFLHLAFLYLALSHLYLLFLYLLYFYSLHLYLLPFYLSYSYLSPFSRCSCYSVGNACSNWAEGARGLFAILFNSHNFQFHLPTYVFYLILHVGLSGLII